MSMMAGKIRCFIMNLMMIKTKHSQFVLITNTVFCSKILLILLVQSRPPRTNFRPSVHPSTSVHIFKFLMVRRLKPSMRWTVCLRPPSTSVHLGQIIMGFRPNSSMRWTVSLRPAVRLRPSMENFHGPSSESVHEMDSTSVRPSISVHLS